MSEENLIVTGGAPAGGKQPNYKELKAAAAAAAAAGQQGGGKKNSLGGKKVTAKAIREKLKHKWDRFTYMMQKSKPQFNKEMVMVLGLHGCGKSSFLKFC